jgi:putative phage-type endonuclease
MLSANYLEERRKGIGGSDVAAILGLSPWKTPYQVYAEKRGEAAKVKGTSQMDWGTRMEPVLRQWYSDTTGRAVRVPDGIITSKQYPFMLASLDGFTDDRRIVEIKTARRGSDWGEPGTNDIPDYYAVQCHHYMIVTGYEVTDVPVSIAGGSPELYEVPADKEIAEMIIDACAAFWRRVEMGMPPDPITYADAVQRFGGLATEGAIVADDNLIKAVAELKSIRDAQKELEAHEDELKGRIIMALGDAGDTLVGPDGKPLATWKLGKGRTTLDAKALKAQRPEIWEEFAKITEPQRRFLIK